ncbi:uncharacterized protein LOC112045318 [Bicyclus anynana]|uniref:Uncharacterized protein LOC112045318 n=1 Tax=Bicyclus anynana TaxID=110368 RepID=A0A6J1MWH9_BICAN|nr:uncharacterized protein LOC112045318 [Bicyclus anynana]
MADAALARREARRRKILENSHNRLQIISGKGVSDLNKENSIPRETAENSVPKESNSVNERFQNNGVINTREDTVSSTNHENFAMGDGLIAMADDTPILIRPDITTVETIEEAVCDFATLGLFSKYNMPKYDLVILTLFLQFLYFISDLTLEDSYIFFPFSVYIISKYIFKYPKDQNNSIANVLLLLNGMSSNRAQKIMSIAQFASECFQDMCIYLFITICMQAGWRALGDNFG